METNISIAGQIIDLFGGIRPMAAKLDTPVTTVQGWKKRGIIPQSRHADILAAAERESIALDPGLLSQTDPATAVRPQARIVEPSPVAGIEAVAPRRNPIAIAAVSISVVVLFLAAGAVFAGWYLYLQPLRMRVAALEANRADPALSADLTARIAKLEAIVPQNRADSTNDGDGGRIAAMEQQIAALKAGSAESVELSKRLSDLQIAAGSRELLTQSIHDIQSSAAATQGEVERLATQFTALGVRLDKVDAVLAEKRQQTLRAEAVILGVGQLRAALRDSKPFSKEIAALKPLVGSDAEMLALLDQIQPFAEDGVETLGELKADFDRLAPNIVRSAVVGDGASWWRQALYRVASVISIRRVGDGVMGDNAEAVVARAGAKLDGDDLQGALTALRGLTGMPADVAQPWIVSAGQRIAADAAESEMTRIAIDRVAAGNPPVSPPPISMPPVSSQADQRSQEQAQ
jgi:hypothetical protein